MVVDNIRRIIFIFGAIAASAAMSVQENYVDPTKPFVNEPIISDKKTVKSQLKLQAIFTRGGRMEAVINDTLIREGDQVLGAVIQKINEDKVFYIKSNKQGVLILRPKVLQKTQGKG